MQMGGGKGVQCLFAVCLLLLALGLPQQLLLVAMGERLPLQTGRGAEPNIREKNNHSVDAGRQTPPLVLLLRPIVANLCKTVPVGSAAQPTGAAIRTVLWQQRARHTTKIKEYLNKQKKETATVHAREGGDIERTICRQLH